MNLRGILLLRRSKVKVKFYCNYLVFLHSLIIPKETFRSSHSRKFVSIYGLWMLSLLTVTALNDGERRFSFVRKQSFSNNFVEEIFFVKNIA
jgi:hypothetical protein